MDKKILMIFFISIFLIICLSGCTFFQDTKTILVNAGEWSAYWKTTATEKHVFETYIFFEDGTYKCEKRMSDKRFLDGTENKYDSKYYEKSDIFHVKEDRIYFLENEYKWKYGGKYSSYNWKYLTTFDSDYEIEWKDSDIFIMYGQEFSSRYK